MDLCGAGCDKGQDGVQNTVKSDKSGTNKVHTQYSTCVSHEVESRAYDFTLETQKTEVNVTPEKSGTQFLAGTEAQLNPQLPQSGSLSKIAMGLSFHVDRSDSSRTIFEDAEYFERHYLYKLMPITLEAVNETIIHIEHNYCNYGPNAFADENPYNTIYSDAEERNYKKRKSKSVEGLFASDLERVEEPLVTSVSVSEGFATNPKLEGEYSGPVQPLDLSLTVFHEQKTDKMLKENQSNIPKVKTESKSTPDPKQFDMCESNKENVTSARKIEVTISRPGQKEYYQPCEVFLNDLARISPDLVKNDCYEIDIIDRTGPDLQKEKCRTYYIVSESTWQTFENSTERIILTNDLNIGEPIQNKEKLEKPTYLIFDQCSLTESLLKICENKGGSFEYTCLKESLPKAQDARREVQDCGSESAVAPDEESNADASKRHLPETNILNNMLLCEKENVETEPDSANASEIVAEPEEQRLETEEKVCDDSAGGEQTEPQVPNEWKRDDVIAESEDRDRKPDAAEIELGRVHCTAGEAAKETDEIRVKEVVASDSSVGNRSRRKKAGFGVVGARTKRRKRKLTVVGELKTEGDESTADVEPSPKRVTRSSTSLPEMSPRDAATKKRRRGKVKKEKKEVVVALEKVEKTPKAKKAVTVEAKSKEETVDGGGKSRKRKGKRSDAHVGVSSVRETRSTAKKKAMENRRRTRGRKEEAEPRKKFY